MTGTGRHRARPPSPLSRLGAAVWQLGFARPRPWTTWLLAAIVVGVFALEVHLGDPAEELFLLHDLGSLRAPLLWAGDWHRLVTSVFLHAGETHFWMNLFGLFLFGFYVERRIGSRRTALLFAFAALLGNAVFVLFRPWEYCVGASGALYGFVALFVAFDCDLHAGRTGHPAFGARFWIVSLFLYGFDLAAARAFDVNLAPEAHWAGYAAGIVFGWVALSGAGRLVRRLAGGVAGAAFAAALVLAVRPVHFPGYHFYVADTTFATEGAEAGLAAYLELEEEGLESAGLRVAYGLYETQGAGAALERLDALSEPERETFPALYLRIAALDDLGRKEEADAAFEELVAWHEEALEGEEIDDGLRRRIQNNVAMARADHRRELAEAHQEMYRILVANVDRNPGLIDTVGWVEIVHRNREDGLLALQESWKRHPEAAVAYHLAEAHASLNEVDEAREFLTRALDPRRNLTLGTDVPNLLDLIRARRLAASLESAEEPSAAASVD